MLLRQQRVRPMKVAREGAVAAVAEIDRTGTGKMVNLQLMVSRKVKPPVSSTATSESTTRTKARRMSVAEGAVVVAAVVDKEVTATTKTVKADREAEVAEETTVATTMARTPAVMAKMAREAVAAVAEAEAVDETMTDRAKMARDAGAVAIVSDTISRRTRLEMVSNATAMKNALTCLTRTKAKEVKSLLPTLPRKPTIPRLRSRPLP